MSYSEGGIIHDVDNLSNHSAVYMNINMDNISHVSNIHNVFNPRTAWYEVSENDFAKYKHAMQENLQPQPQNVKLCNDIKCNSKGHEQMITDSFDEFINIVCKASQYIYQYSVCLGGMNMSALIRKMLNFGES